VDDRIEEAGRGGDLEVLLTASNSSYCSWKDGAIDVVLAGLESGKGDELW
jgi:hypothetical protein